MLNIFADALLIASRIGRLPTDSTSRNLPDHREFETRQTTDALQNRLR